LTRRIRDLGAPKGVLCHSSKGEFDLNALHRQACEWPGLEGLDLAKDVCCSQSYDWNQMRWNINTGYANQSGQRHHVVVMDFGVKQNILRSLASTGCRVTVVPGTSSIEEILAHKPDGIFLSNGPGDPAATGEYAVPVIKELLNTGLPLFGICLGHQMLALALGGKTEKMHLGHRGANHPVKNLLTGKVEITSQNHNFAVDVNTLDNTRIEVTHINLNDQTVEGIKHRKEPMFCVQYHPEAGPGPHDPSYLFSSFRELIRKT